MFPRFPRSNESSSKSASSRAGPYIAAKRAPCAWSKGEGSLLSGRINNNRKRLCIKRPPSTGQQLFHAQANFFLAGNRPVPVESIEIIDAGSWNLFCRDEGFVHIFSQCCSTLGAKIDFQPLWKRSSS